MTAKDELRDAILAVHLPCDHKYSADCTGCNADIAIAEVLKTLDDCRVIREGDVPDGISSAQHKISKMYFEPQEVAAIHVIQQAAQLIEKAKDE